MKSKVVIPVALTTLLFGTTAIANSVETQELTEIQKQHVQFIEQGKSHKEAYKALDLKVEYNASASQSRTPCKRMVRGL